MKFRIYFSKTGFGLRKDARIICDALKHFGYEAEIVEMPASEVRFGGFRGLCVNMLKAFNVLFFYKAVQNLFFRNKDTMGIHLESIFYEKLYLPEHHVVIPNQEWFEVSHIALLPYIKEVWVKTKFAQGIFAQYKRPVRYIAFCSVLEEYDASVIKRRDYFFSRTGMSEYRGAENLINVWARHPEWPPLKLVIHPSRRPATKPGNVEFLDIFPRVEDFVRFASSSLFHIYATETEGFGHSILEAMGYGSVVMVTDAPPMNEIATDQCAILLGAAYSGQKSIAPRFAVVPSALEEAVESAMQLDEESITKFSDAARQRFLDFKEEFYSNLEKAVKSCQ
ncbi:MAG TPA: glycosyltransferase [Cellvibrio sp.]|nr:glycosyltransferase [Cellvibrio sp.]